MSEDMRNKHCKYSKVVRVFSISNLIIYKPWYISNYFKKLAHTLKGKSIDIKFNSWHAREYWRNIHIPVRRLPPNPCNALRFWLCRPRTLPLSNSDYTFTLPQGHVVHRISGINWLRYLIGSPWRRMVLPRRHGQSSADTQASHLYIVRRTLPLLIFPDRTFQERLSQILRQGSCQLSYLSVCSESHAVWSDNTYSCSVMQLSSLRRRRKNYTLFWTDHCFRSRESHS